jgi:bilin biosynthesis protein
MDRRFSNIFPGLSEERAIALLRTPTHELEDKSDRYIAAAHLVNFPSERAINALIETLGDCDADLDSRIARRKAIETLGRLQASSAIPAIRQCLHDPDIYTVENAVWAIGEIGTDDETILAEIAELLSDPKQIHRIIIHVLAKLGYRAALEKILPFTCAEDPTVASAAIATVCRFKNDSSRMPDVVQFLHHPTVNARRACIQDLMDARYYAAMPDIAACPISMVFRIRGIAHLATTGMATGELTFAQIEPSLDAVIRDRPDELNLVHEYPEPPALDFLINELYHTDFGRCYLASQAILDLYPQPAPPALIDTFVEKAWNDYGAHYHVIKLLGWLQYQPAYKVLVESLHNKRPQFQKSRTAAAIALGHLGDKRAIEELKTAGETPIWELQYACLIALAQLGDPSIPQFITEDTHPFVRAKANLTANALSL